MEDGGGGPVCPLHEASKGLIPPPTWQGLPVGLEAVHGYEVCSQLKHGPLQSHVCSRDFSGDDVKGAEGGNPDSLQVKEKQGVEGLWACWRKGWR